MKVAAVDPATGREAVIVGDARESRETLARMATAKLEFLLKSKK